MGVNILKQSKLKKIRHCDECNNNFYTDAEGMRGHIADHRMEKRAIAAGIILPKRGPLVVHK